MSNSGSNPKGAAAWDGVPIIDDDNNNNSNNNNSTTRQVDGPVEPSASGRDTRDSNDPMSMSLTSDEVNYLVFRYLQESGFVHSAFTFVYESMLGKSNIRNGDRTIPPGALISFLQKGLQYVGIEETLQRESKGQKANKDDSVGVEHESDFALLSQPVIAALTRDNHPIQLNLPASAAAAAVKSRLETEAKLKASQDSRQQKAAAPSTSTTGGFKQHTIDQGAANDAEDASMAQAIPSVSLTTQQPLVAGEVPSGLAAMKISVQQQDERLNASNISEQEASITHTQQSRPPGDDVQGLLALSNSTVTSNKSAKRKKSKGSKKQVPQQQEQEVEGESSNPLHLFSAVARLEASQTEKNSTAAMEVDADNGQIPLIANKVNKEQDLMNGQHPYPPNGSRTNNLLPVNGKSDAMVAAEALAGVSAQNSEPESMEKRVDREDRLTNASSEEILELRMHSSEVFMCAWNPVFTSFIATGSGDASARIWQMGGADAKAGLGPVRLLPHGEDPRDKKNKDVTTLEWSSDGKLLATGSYDGVARVWSRSGALLHTLRGHKGPIFSLKWNKRGNFLLSGSYDKTTIVWDVSSSTGFVKQQFNDHDAPALDVDWKDDTTFASCSTDKTVNICQVGFDKPLKTYSGHADEVNAVKWDPSGTLLASCSDDCTAKVWEVNHDRSGPLQDFTSHSQEIYTVKWSPTGPGSANPTKPRILATASFDGSVRLWDVQDGSCIKVFSRHRDSVYSVAFSPSGSFLASGSLAGQLYIWHVIEGRPVKSYKSKGDIFEVAWNKEETRVAACFSSNIVAILDFKIKP